MRLLLSNHITNAYESLRGNRLRTSLTILGVTIGVASITVILSLSGGAAKIITDQVDQLGGTIAVVRPGAVTKETQVNNLTASLAGSQPTSSLTEHDVNNIRDLPHITAVAPIMLLSGGVTAGDNTPGNVSIVATTPDLTKVTDLPMIDGQFIDSVTNRDTAVIGAQLSVDLFGTEQSIGRTFRTHGQTFTVIGVLKHLNNPINYNNIDFDHAAIVSLDSGKTFNQNVAHIAQINIKADTVDNLPGALTQIRKVLNTNHQGEQDYTVLSGNDLSRPSNELFSTISATLVTVAAISLVVGGIGIMNIMLVGVSERTREIGIRKALGASDAHITWQFLIESLAMSLAGGILGYFFGYLLAFAVARSFLTFDPLFSWQIAVATLGISLVVGLLFGLYPAIRAARKDPIEALRQYH
jgi:putative ABC transport system permease protein